MRTDARQASEIRTWAGALALIGAAVSAELAWLHMRAVEAMGTLCGTAAEPHCGWCPAALVLLAVGVFLLRAPAPRPQPVRIATKSKRAGR